MESSEDSKKHKSKLKELGAAIQKLLKKHDDDDDATKGDILDQKIAKIETVKEKKVSKIKPKNATIEEITGALVKAANSKHKIKNTTMEDLESSGKSLKNESIDGETTSFEENSKSHEKGDKIMEDLGLKKKKGLPLATAVARGEKPPCICPDKGTF